HLLGDEHGHVLSTVVDGDRVPDHLGEDRRGAGPGADHPLVPGGVHLLDPLHQALFDERALLGRSAHLALLLAASTGTDDQRVGFLVLRAGPLPERGDAPRRHGMAAALGLALAAAMGMVDRVHPRAANGGALAAPAAPARLAARLVLVVDVPD